MNLLRERMPSPIGTLWLVTDGEALRALDFEDHEHRLHRLLRRHYGACTLTPGNGAGGFAIRLRAWFEGGLAAIDSIPVGTAGSPFQRLVSAALRRIPAAQRRPMGNSQRDPAVRQRAGRWGCRMGPIRWRSWCPAIG